MSNKEIIKKLFDEELDSRKMRNEILEKYERKGKNKVFKIIKYSTIPICLVIAVFIGIFLNNKNILEEKSIGIMKVYAYTISDDEKMEKKELKESVKLGLAKYSQTMSSVPGYPIMFELSKVDYINIEVSNGTILDWNNASGKVKELGNTYQLSHDWTLYFDVNENTSIKITGIKNKKEIFEKNITISSDDNYNYYALLK